MIINDKPIFILGIGAQKAGTSWLHAQLNRLDEVDMGEMKEYHVWDWVFLNDNDFKKKPVANNYKESLRQIMREEDGVYENYFSEIIDGNIRVTGDFTPSYSLLSAENFHEIKEKLESVGFCVKVLFFMRDPVARNWSGIGMSQRRLEKSGNPMSDSKRLKMFDKFYRKPDNTIRTRYDKTITEVEKAFPKESIYYGFYENMFSKESIEQISKFLTLDLSDSNTDRVINGSKKTHLSLEKYSKCRKYFSEVYDFCEDAFPETKTLWKDLS